MRLVTERLTVDDLRPADAQDLFAVRGHPEVARYQGWCPTSLEEVEQFIARNGMPVSGGWVQYAIRLTEGGEWCGDLGVKDDGEQVVFGVSLAPDHQGRGYASEVLRALFAFVFGAGRHRVFASVDPRNTPSMALLERVGMRKEAHHRQSLWFKGEWVDDVVFALLASEFSG